MTDEMKKEAMKIAEKHLIIAIDDVYALAQIYVDSTEETLDNTILDGLKMLKGFLIDMADKVDGEENA